MLANYLASSLRSTLSS